MPKILYVCICAHKASIENYTKLLDLHNSHNMNAKTFATHRTLIFLDTIKNPLREQNMHAFCKYR